MSETNETASTAISEQALQQLIETQKKEQELRSYELQIRLQELQHQSKHASEILSAQERDRDKEREHNRQMQRVPIIALSSIFVAALLFAAWALHLNKDTVVMDILKITLGFAAGGAGGYGFAKAKQRESDN